jgi:hypothetical protein
MSQGSIAKRAVFARRYQRRQEKKESYFFRAMRSEPGIAFIPEESAKVPKRASGDR